MANKQDGTVRVAGVLPGNGKWRMTNSSGIQVETEVLAFVVIERAWTNGHVAIHVEAIGVDAPEITYTPFPDEDSNYYLIDRPPQEKEPDPFLNLAELSGTMGS
jgi:hypothetical protein